MNKEKYRKEYQLYLFFLEWRMKILGPLARFLLKKKITPNFVTTLRLCLVIPIVLLLRSYSLLAAAFILLNMILDGLDGVMARTAKLESIKGSIFDAAVDNFFEIPIVLSVIYWSLSSPFLGSLYLVLLLINHITNYFVYGLGPGKYKFSYGKYFVYLSVLILALFSYEVFDLAFIFWSALYFIFNIENIYKIVRNAKFIK